MEKLDTYLSLCTQYYDLDKPDAPDDAFAFYLQYANRIEGKILEPMCGSGRFLIPIMELGYDIEGFDASQFMLEALYIKCKNKKIKPRVWQGFVQDLDKNNIYNLAFIPSGSLNLITNLDQLKHSLKNIHHSLVPGGTFVIELITLAEAERQETNRWWSSMQTIPDGRKIVISSMNLPLINNIGQSICRYELIENNQIVKTEVETYELQFYEADEMESLLTEAGFSNIRTIKAFEHGKMPDESDDVIVYECSKLKYSGPHK